MSCLVLPTHGLVNCKHVTVLHILFLFSFGTSLFSFIFYFRMIHPPGKIRFLVVFKLLFETVVTNGTENYEYFFLSRCHNERGIAQPILIYSIKNHRPHQVNIDSDTIKLSLTLIESSVLKGQVGEIYWLLINL